MVKTTEFRDFDDRAMTHNLALDRTLLFQRQMRTRSMVVVEVCRQRPLQMVSVQDNEVSSNPQQPQSSTDFISVNAIPISDQISRYSVAFMARKRIRRHR
jgi:hypothetical protein